MKSKTVAERAAELGTDKEELVRALKALCRYRIKSGPMRYGKTASWMHAHWYTPKTPLMSLEQAARFLGVDPADANKEIELSYPITWTQKKVLDALFAFLKEHNRWPLDKDFRRANGLPSASIYRDFTDWSRGTRDVWERRAAKDRRFTAKMLPLLRNVLARKEAIERIGVETLIRQRMASVIAKDPEFGTLYQLPGETPAEPMVLLKVVNSTPNPDGTFADYYLRVPPDMTDVREALKWTFNGNEALGSQPYAPLIET